MKFVSKLFSSRRFLYNKTALLSICSSFIALFEKEIQKDHYCDSCKEILLKELDLRFKAEYDRFCCLDEKIDNFTEIAVAYISTVSFDFFEYCWFRIGGKYHIYRYCSPMMSRIHFKALQWGYDHGFVTKEEIEEDKLAFDEVVRQRT